MSRHFRSAYSIAQVAVAGPSRAAVQPTLRPTMHLSRRTLFGSFIPPWLSRRREDDAKKRREQREAEERKAAGVVETVPVQTVQGEGGIFGDVVPESSEDKSDRTAAPASRPVRVQDGTRGPLTKKTRFTEHTYTSAKHKISPKKLELLAHQIQGLPVDEAILQMQFSLKGAAKWIKPNLVMAKDHAIDYKNMKPERLMVAAAIVNKEKYGPKQMDIKGRGRFGIKRHPYCRLKIVLKEGRTMEEKVAIRFRKDVNKHARSAGLVRENTKIRRKSPSAWAW